ncbi:hypothetical protein V3C99_013174 [Haemonchus contortus]
MLAIICVTTVLTLLCVATATCISFHRKKTDLPGSPSKQSTKPRTFHTGSNLWGRIPLCPAMARRYTVSRSRSQQTSTTTQSTITAPSSASASTSAEFVMDGTQVKKSKSQDGKDTGKRLSVEKTQSLHSAVSFKEELGEIQLVKAKKKRNIEDILKNCPKVEKKSSDEEFISESESFDDTLRGVESLKTDHVTSLAPRTSADTISKNIKTKTETKK